MAVVATAHNQRNLVWQQTRFSTDIIIAYKLYLVHNERLTMNNIKDMSLDELKNYKALTDPIVCLVKALWDTENFAPTDLKLAVEQVNSLSEEYISECVQKVVGSIQHASDETDTQISCAEMLTPWRVANEVEVWKSDPVELLIQAVFTYGMNVQAAIQRKQAPPSNKAEA